MLSLVALEETSFQTEFFVVLFCFVILLALYVYEVRKNRK